MQAGEHPVQARGEDAVMAAQLGREAVAAHCDGARPMASRNAGDRSGQGWRGCGVTALSVARSSLSSVVITVCTPASRPCTRSATHRSRVRSHPR